MSLPDGKQVFLQLWYPPVANKKTVVLKLKNQAGLFLFRPRYRIFAMMRKLKTLRIVLSVVLLLMSTLLAADISGMFPYEAHRLERMQFIPALLSMGIGIDVFWLAFSFTFGRLYCSSVCPLGTLQDVFSRLGSLLVGKKSPRYRYRKPDSTLRYAILFSTVLCLILGLLFIPAVIDPYSAYSRMVQSIVAPSYILGLEPETGKSAVGTLLVPGVAGLGVAAFSVMAIAVISVFKGRLYCNTVCPVGTLMGLCSRNPVWHFEIDTDKCTDCRRCEEACKASCIDLSNHTVDMSRCVGCFNCTAACRDGAIAYTPYRKRPMTPLMQRLKEKAAEKAATPSLTMTDGKITGKRRSKQGM